MSKIKLKSIDQLRGGYVNRRTLYHSLNQRLRQGSKSVSLQPGYRRPEIDFTTNRGKDSMVVRDYDISFLRQTKTREAEAYLSLIIKARQGDASAKAELTATIKSALDTLERHFGSLELTENEFVVPSTTDNHPAETVISNKGAVLLQLIQEGYPIPDFTFLTSKTFNLSPIERQARLREVISNLERLTGQDFGGSKDPLLAAMRCAMPTYIPGFMPTYLNVGVTEKSYPALVERYGHAAASRILLNNLKTIMMVLDPAGYKPFAAKVRPDLDRKANEALSDQLMSAIEKKDPELLIDPFYQAEFFLGMAYGDFASNYGLLQSFMSGQEHFPTMIFQKMVCSVLNKSSYAGVLYSRHPRNGQGSRLEFARGMFGEEIMTGGVIIPQEKDFSAPEQMLKSHPAVAHFFPDMAKLENRFAGPVTIEFAAENGLFAMLQLNAAELTGSGTMVAVMDLFRSGAVSAQRVRDLIKPYHIRQLESPAIDRHSLETLKVFAQGNSVLPRTAISGRIYFSSKAAQKAKWQTEDPVILAKDTFVPTDTVTMSQVDGIASLTPAAIHVVTTAQNLGIPALVNLERSGITIDHETQSMRNQHGKAIKEGSWVTISSRFGTLFAGKAKFAEARLLAYMAGREVKLTAAEKQLFERLAQDYQEYKNLMEAAQANEIAEFKGLHKFVQKTRLDEKEEALAVQVINAWFDANFDQFVEGVFNSGLGDHLMTGRVFDRLPLEKKIRFYKAAVAKCKTEGLQGQSAGSFFLGRSMRDLPVSFWNNFSAEETAVLLNEWIWDQRYSDALSFVGERKIRKAMEYMEQKDNKVHLHSGTISELFALKLSQVDLAAVRKALKKNFAPQLNELLDLLLKPWGELVDYDSGWSFNRFRSDCEAAAVPVPDAKDI